MEQHDERANVLTRAMFMRRRPIAAWVAAAAGVLILCCLLACHRGGGLDPTRRVGAAHPGFVRTSQGVVQPQQNLVAKTMENMIEVAVSFQSYTIDNGGYPLLADLRDPRSDFYTRIAGTDFVLRDAWGHEMLVRMTPRHGLEPEVSDDFLIVSAGADGQFDESTWNTTGENTTLDEDLVLSGPGWIRWYPAEPTHLVRCCRPRAPGWPDPKTGAHEIREPEE